LRGSRELPRPARGRRVLLQCTGRSISVRVLARPTPAMRRSLASRRRATLKTSSRSRTGKCRSTAGTDLRRIRRPFPTHPNMQVTGTPPTLRRSPCLSNLSSLSNQVTPKLRSTPQRRRAHSDPLHRLRRQLPRHRRGAARHPRRQRRRRLAAPCRGACTHTPSACGHPDSLRRSS
jgi:hypothetical protein